MNLVQSRMTESDIDEVLIIEQLSFRTPWSRQAFIGELANNPLAHYLVGRFDSRLVCYGGAWMFLGEAHVTNVAVHPDFRGLGLGEAICRALMAEARALGIERMTLEVRFSNTVAQELYRKLGFYSAGVRPGYYTDTKEDALIMWNDNLLSQASEEEKICVK